MRSRALFIFVAAMILGVGAAVYAFSSTANVDAAASACCHGEKACPMKAGVATADGKTRAHECACAGHEGKGHSAEMSCKAAHADGASCKMMAGKNKDAMAAHKMEGEMKHHEKMADGASCPIKGDAKNAAEHKGMHTKTEGGMGCGCCSHAEKKAAPAM